MVDRFSQGFEAGLTQLAQGLDKPRGAKSCDKINERIGKLKAKSRGNSQHYVVTPTTDETGKTVVALTWQKIPVPGTMATDPGVYCLRSNELGWDEEKLWRTYTMLTDLESVFRSLKSELGLRPVFHSKELRCDGHLHHGAGLPVRADGASALEGRRDQRRLGQPAEHAVGPAPRDRKPAALGRPHGARAQEHGCRAGPDDHLPRLGTQSLRVFRARPSSALERRPVQAEPGHKQS